MLLLSTTFTYVRTKVADLRTREDGVTAVEYALMEGDVITLQDIYTFDYRAGIDENGRFRGIIQPTGLRPRFLERLSDHGIHFDADLFTSDTGTVPLAMRR